MTDKNTILITPEQTLIGGKPMQPTSINIILDNGHSYDLDTMVTLLEKHDRKVSKKLNIFSRTRRGFRAFKQAIKETDNSNSNETRTN
jgi:hypothetical protein